MISKIMPGMRTIKTSISIFIVLFIYDLIGLQSPVYACLAAAVCMQKTVDDTIKSGKSRLIGTCIAAAVGLSVYFFGENVLNSNGYLIIIPIGIILTIQLCVLLNCASSSSVGCIVYLTIVTSHRIIGDNMTYPFIRIYETLIGVVIATIVNRLISRDVYNKFIDIFSRN